MMSNFEKDRIVTFTADGLQRYGIVVDSGIVDLSVKFPEYTNLRQVIEADKLASLARNEKNSLTDFYNNEFRYDIPIPFPEKIICVGVNYPARNEEYKDGSDAPLNPSLFIRFPGSFVGHQENIIRPLESKMLDYEGEVTIIIGKGGRRIPERSAYDHIAGLTLCNEGTLRDWVRHAKFNVTQGKNFESSGSMGPWIVPFLDSNQIDGIELETRVNGEVRQKDNTSRMIFSFRKIIAYVSTFTNLVPGDVIVCGTPVGAGARFDPPKWLKPGDKIEVEAEGIGVLSNSVVDEVIS